MAILSAIMTILPLAFALHWVQPANFDSDKDSAAFAAAAFFGLGTIILLWRLFAASGPILTIGPHGIRHVRVAAEFIPWAAIESIRTWTYDGQRILVLKVYPGLEEKLSLTKIARFTRSANKALGADGLCIAATDLKISYDHLLECVVAYANAHRAQAIEPLSDAARPARIRTGR